MQIVRTAIIVAVSAIALLMLGNAGLWLVQPAVAAANIKMPLLSGAALSSQMDIAAFFLATGLFAALGVATRKAEWFIAAAILLLGAAAFRTLAFAFHGAEFLGDMVAAEIVMGALLLAAAKILTSPHRHSR